MKRVLAGAFAAALLSSALPVSAGASDHVAQAARSGGPALPDAQRYGQVMNVQVTQTGLFDDFPVVAESRR